MRWLIPIVVFAFTLGTASAQRPWDDYDQRQRAEIVASHKVPVEVRGLVGSLDTLSVAERARLRDIVTRPVRDRQLQSLYLFIYETLRPVDGTWADDDVAMLERHTAYFLERWSSELHGYDVYNYAYAIGRHSACEEVRGEVNALLRRVCKRRYVRRYGDVVMSFGEGVAIAASSVGAGRSVRCDNFVPEAVEYAPHEITIGEYDGIVATIEAVGMAQTATDGAVEALVAAECMAWDGSYNRPVDHGFADAVSVVVSTSSTDRLIKICDDRGDGMVLRGELYMLPDGGLFAVDDGEDGCARHVVVGRVDALGLHIEGRVTLDGGEMVGRKCTAEGLYLRLKYGDNERCIMLSGADYERY